MYIHGIFPANRVSIYHLLYHLLREPGVTPLICYHTCPPKHLSRNLETIHLGCIFRLNRMAMVPMGNACASCDIFSGPLRTAGNENNTRIECRCHLCHFMCWLIAASKQFWQSGDLLSLPFWCRFFFPTAKGVIFFTSILVQWRVAFQHPHRRVSAKKVKFIYLVHDGITHMMISVFVFYFNIAFPCIFELKITTKPLYHDYVDLNILTQGISSPLTCEPRKKPLLLSIESWLVNKDPYNGLL